MKSTHGTVAVEFDLNGDPVYVEVAVQNTLLDLLRDGRGLTGTKVGCGVGVCGACTVLVDGTPASSCLTLTAQMQGRNVETIEGVDHVSQVSMLQEAFIEEGGFQCGFCTAGQIMTLLALCRTCSAGIPTDDEIVNYLNGSVCRCTGYYGILRAARSVLHR